MYTLWCLIYFNLPLLCFSDEFSFKNKLFIHVVVNLKWFFPALFFFPFSSLGPEKKMTISRLFAHPKFKHFLLLAKIFTLSIILLTADIVTDFLTAIEFFQNCHFYWGLFTLVPIFAPFLAKIVFSFWTFAQCFERTSEGLQLDSARFSFWKKDLWKLIWQFPMLQILR